MVARRVDLAEKPDPRDEVARDDPSTAWRPRSCPLPSEGAPPKGITTRARACDAQAGHGRPCDWPEIRGLGTSSMAVEYGLDGPDEGAAYLDNRVLTARLVDAVSAVRAHVARSQASPARLETVMGSRIDAQKLVSSMTLFAHLARRADIAGRPDLGALARGAEAILVAAAAEGCARCAFTEKALRLSSR